MKIVAEDLGKRYNRDWIFRHFSFTIEPGKTYAITGSNGSGKSTLSQVLWGQLPPTVGKLRYLDGEKLVDGAEVFHSLSIAAPYMDVIEEFTLQESVDFHFKFKKPVVGVTSENVLRLMDLEAAKDKKVAAFSSGMKQRLKLALAFFSDTPLLFLDEPTTNLDRRSIDWYQARLAEQSGRTIVIASNQEHEYPANAVKIDISNYKTKGY